MAELEAEDAIAAAGGVFGAVAALLERLCADVGRRLPPGAAEGLLWLESLLRGKLPAVSCMLVPTMGAAEETAARSAADGAAVSVHSI